MLAKRAIMDYLDANGWLEVTSTTIASLTGACETVSTVFVLDYFERRAHLAQTAQLQLEMLVKELKRKVWTFDHSFRAEPRTVSGIVFCQGQFSGLHKLSVPFLLRQATFLAVFMPFPEPGLPGTTLVQ
jgi:hypothetical protein